jgi:hypothetical protein
MQNIIMQRMILPVIALVAVTASGCAYSPRYKFDAPPQRVNPCHNGRVAVIPIAQHWDADWDGQWIVDKDSCAEMLTKHLAHEKVFAYQKAVRDKGMKRSQLIKEIQKKDYDAILAVSIMTQIRAAAVQSNLGPMYSLTPVTGGLGTLLLVDAAAPRDYSVQIKVKFELISTSNNKVIWEGEEIGSAKETTADILKLLTQSFKNAFTELINKIETAEEID